MFDGCASHPLLGAGERSAGLPIRYFSGQPAIGVTCVSGTSRYQLVAVVMVAMSTLDARMQ
ncbi:hypothetical protein E2C01_048779 [Portunus trituberculatus]|uniref:Uncharacterized protein n=1 Tax=Portunus trituberculatus TaxID=210409 RepID=A0A5B7G3Z4_PORTR|nr:hypothetical protein [Portunus trituberculatus]